MADEVVVSIHSDEDMVEARAKSRSLADELGFSRTDATLIATAISEIARNILVHAGRGEISMRPLSEDGRYGLASWRATPVLAYAMSIGPLSLGTRRGVDWGWGYPAPGV